MSRRLSRQHAFCLVFQIEFDENIDIEKSLNNYINEFANEENEKFDKDFMLEEYKGTYENLAEIDESISKKLKGWTIARLNKTDIALLRLAVYELKFKPDIPHSVTIKEIVDLSRIYSTDNSPNFLNGILGSISKETMRPNNEENSLHN